MRLPSDHINGLALGLDGTVWVATSRGVAGIDGGNVRIIDQRHGLPGRIAYAVNVDFEGHLWVGTDRGAVVFRPTGPLVFSHLGGELPHDWVTAIRPVEDCVFIGTYDAGVTRSCADGRSVFLSDLGDRWVNPHGLFVKGHALLVSTLGTGLFVRHQDQLRRVAGLPSSDVTSIEILDSTVWIATRGGLASASIDHVFGAGKNEIAVR